VRRRSPGPKLAIALTLIAAVGAGAAGCRHKSKSPAEAYRRFADAVRSGDGGAVFDALDQDTRWAYMTIQKWHREAYDIVLSNYPEGPEREREGHRFEHWATASSARDLFKQELAPALLPTFQPLVADDATIQPGPDDDHATAVLASGARAPLAHGKDGGWGFAGLDKQVDDEKNRAYHDLEVVRASAADYERAAARAGK
jgi:hypothetical protein